MDSFIINIFLTFFAIVWIYFYPIIFGCIKYQTTFQKIPYSTSRFNNRRWFYLTKFFKIKANLFCKVNRSLIIAIFTFTTHN
ncbi:unknown [Firmicutes bacterium CAG:102]|nr:unknown [Firmicutes bacterium CAG:102]